MGLEVRWETNIVMIDKNKINKNDITFIVQGAVEPKKTKKCLKSIRRYFPASRIILSTWKGTDCSDLPYDKLILNEDPGFEYLDTNKKLKYNINRMFVSTQNGLRECNTKYAFKVRSDLVFHSDHILRYFDKYPKYLEEFKVFKHKVIVGNLFSMKYEVGEDGKFLTPFHVSDFFQFGLTEDLQLLYDVPLVDLQDFSRYFERHEKPRKYPVKRYDETRLWRFPPEQYLNLTLARRKQEIKFDTCLDYNEELMALYEKFVLSNYIILDYDQTKIKSQKFTFKLYASLNFLSETLWPGLYRNYVYESDYTDIVDSAFKLGVDKRKLIRRLFAPYHRNKELVKKIANHLRMN